MPTNVKTFTSTIAASGNLSGAVKLGGYTPVALIMPSGWDAGGITFQVTHDGDNYANLYDAAGEYALTTSAVGTSRVILLVPGDLLGFIGIKLRSGTSGTPVTQTAERIITIVATRAAVAW